jgi:peptide chain release factor 2
VFWEDVQQAQMVMQRLARLKKSVETWRDIEGRVTHLHDLICLGIDDDDELFEESLREEFSRLIVELDSLELELVLSGPYDHRTAILAIHAGAGGTESQDWAEMLLRMYVRWAERRRFTARVLDLSAGEEAGIKSVLLEVTGQDAYGYMKAERGVHRLVRLSPFDVAHLRHTSFALVEVLPMTEQDTEVVIRSDDLRVDVFRSSGAGGQNVQKNSTAVRITHLPTGIVVSCQNERSQLQNREMAMQILRARLMEKEMERQAEEHARLKGEHVSAGWGNQIRSYVLHPYKLVKDHRTDYETSDPGAVLDGDLDGLLNAYLLSMVGHTR